MKQFAFAFLALMSLCLTPLTGFAETLDEPTMKAKLLEVLGDKTNWNAPAFKDFKRDAPCEDVKKVFTSIACDATQEYTTAKVAVTNSPVLDGYEIIFNNGKLYSVNLVFKGSLDKELFKKVSLEVGEAKWGAVQPDKRGADIVGWVSPGYDVVQRTYKNDHWQIKIIAPH